MKDPLLASDLLQQLQQQYVKNDGNDASIVAVIHYRTTEAILSVIQLLDDCGARTWPHWGVAFTTALLFGLVRLVGQKKYGIDWYCFVHAWMSAAGSVMVVYLDVFQSQSLTGTPEPLRACLCHGPLTSLHRLLPAISIGYSLFDFIDGIRISFDFAAHGAVTLFTLSLFCYMEAPQFTAPFLIMEVSTVFLVMVRATFMTEFWSFCNQIYFMISFFVVRCVISPILYIVCVRTMLEQPQTWRDCHPWYLLPVYTILGIFFHTLNAYWMIKILQKARRKLSGQEGIRSNNDMSDPSSLHGPKSKGKDKAL